MALSRPASKWEHIALKEKKQKGDVLVSKERALIRASRLFSYVWLCGCSRGEAAGGWRVNNGK